MKHLIQPHKVHLLQTATSSVQNLQRLYKGLKKWVFIELAVQKDLISDASGVPRDITNKVDEANPTCTKGGKQRCLSEDETLDITTCKKCKVSVHMRIFTYRINSFKRKWTFT